MRDPPHRRHISMLHTCNNLVMISHGDTDEALTRAATVATDLNSFTQTLFFRLWKQHSFRSPASFL